MAPKSLDFYSIDQAPQRRLNKVKNGVGGAIKSIQHGYVDLPTSTSSGAASISSVDLNTSIIIRRGLQEANGNWGPMHLQFNSDTQIGGYRQAWTVAIHVQFTVVEYSSYFVKSVQHGYTNLLTSTAIGTTSISSVDVNKSIIIHRGTQSDDGAYPAVTHKFDSGTQISATRQGNLTNALAIYWSVLEFK